MFRFKTIIFCLFVFCFFCLFPLLCIILLPISSQLWVKKFKTNSRLYIYSFCCSSFISKVMSILLESFSFFLKSFLLENFFKADRYKSLSFFNLRIFLIYIHYWRIFYLAKNSRLTVFSFNILRILYQFFLLFMVFW